MTKTVLFGAALLAAAAATALPTTTTTTTPTTTTTTTRPGLANCQLHWYNQTTDHFNFSPPKGEAYFQQRYYTCSEHWRARDDGRPGPILLYAGNEGDVTLYLNHTGLMWENAPKLGALLMFAEHRYYGQSYPKADISYLTVEQAMRDYAELTTSIKQTYNATDAPVVVLGGSYGGLLAGWMRLKYPGTFHAALASSPPYRVFVRTSYPVTFWETITFDASAEGGSAPACKGNVKATWPALFELGETAEGRWRISNAFRTCAPLKDISQVKLLADIVKNTFATLAMGNFPYPSTYLTEGKEPGLPAYPVRAACEHLRNPELANDIDALFDGMRLAAGTILNKTGEVSCLAIGGEEENTDRSNEDEPAINSWEYQRCAQLISHSQFEGTNGITDMFYPAPDLLNATVAECSQRYHMRPQVGWHDVSFGTFGDIERYGSNIVFTAGKYDPWFGSCVLESLSPSLPAYVIDQGAHHVDLFFSDPRDPPQLTEVRRKTINHISAWLAEYYADDNQNFEQTGDNREITKGGKATSSNDGGNNEDIREINLVEQLIKRVDEVASNGLAWSKKLIGGS